MKYKIERIKKLLLEEVMIILTSHKLKDPRIPEFITITRVTVSKDLHYCHLYFSAIGMKTSRETAVQGLNNASGYIQKIVSEKLSLQYTPKIEFRYDVNEEKAFEVDDLLFRLSEERNQKDSNQKKNDE